MSSVAMSKALFPELICRCSRISSAAIVGMTKWRWAFLFFPLVIFPLTVTDRWILTSSPTISDHSSPISSLGLRPVITVFYIVPDISMGKIAEYRTRYMLVMYIVPDIIMWYDSSGKERGQGTSEQDATKGRIKINAGKLWRNKRQGGKGRQRQN